jgi:hypothetical protein
LGPASLCPDASSDSLIQADTSATDVADYRPPSRRQEVMKMGTITRTFDFRSKKPGIDGLNGGGHSWKDVHQPAPSGPPGNFADGDIYLGLGHEDGLSNLQWRWDDGLCFRVQRSPASDALVPLNSSSVGVFLWCGDGIIGTELDHARKLTLAIQFDSAEVMYHGAGGSDFQCSIVAGMRQADPPAAGGMSSASEDGTYPYCRTSAQFVRNANYRDPSLLLNVVAGSLSSTSTASTIYSQPSDIVQGGSLPPGAQVEFLVQPQREFCLELQLMDASMSGPDTQSRLWQPCAAQVKGDWSRKNFAGAWTPPALSPLGSIDWIGASLAVRSGDIDLSARLLRMVVRYELP